MVLLTKIAVNGDIVAGLFFIAVSASVMLGVRLLVELRGASGRSRLAASLQRLSE